MPPDFDIYPGECFLFHEVPLRELGFMRALTLLFLVIAALSGCARSEINTKVQSFAASDRLGATDKVFVLFGGSSQSGSLEEASYLNLVRTEFGKKGISTVDTIESATALAALTLNIDAGRDQVAAYDLRMWTERTFVRRGSLVISRRSSAGRAQRIFESQAISEGGCPLLAELAPFLIEALFLTFPDGGSRTVSKSYFGRC
ncbi:MAG: hypothetical protein ACK5X3_19305 [Pseudomonadota bacterium]